MIGRPQSVIRGAKEGAQSRNIEAGTETETSEEQKICLPALLPDSQSAAVFILPRLMFPGVLLSTVCWTFLHQLAVKKMPHILAWRMFPG